jgi:DNA-binding winged helix-turn-helix (wHTH) protein/tetratricopeptide (TPR) repeat protein
MINNGKHFFEFGDFRLDPGRRLLLRENQPIQLQPKAFDTLLALVQNSGRVVTKDELMKLVWPDAFVEESNLTQNIFVLRKTLGETAGEHRFIVTVPGRGYRFAEVVREVTDVDDVAVESHPSQVTIEEKPVAIEEKKVPAAPRWAGWKVFASATAALTMAAGAYWYLNRTPKLTGNDTVVLADFVNSTDDAVFDGTLRRGLSAQLEQSPFLNLLSDQRIAQALSLMARAKGTSLTPEIAREVCQRTASAAVLNGAIAQVGTRYLLTLKAINCANGESLASVDEQASDKSHVLDALGKAASRIRPKLGESLASVQKYDAPAENVTTASLEALQAYSLGYQAMDTKNDFLAAIPLFQRAIGLDANFAMAYARMGTCYFNADQPERAAANLQKAYELRERVSEWEKLYIAVLSSDIVTRDFEAARKTDEMWAQIYPRDDVPIGNLAVIYSFLGNYEKALAASQRALKLNPGSGKILSNIVISFLQLNRLDEAKAAARQAQSLHLDSPFFHANLYLVDFLEHDAAAMEQDASELMGKPGWEDLVLYNESDTASFSGHFVKARELTRRAADSAVHADKKETAAAYKAEAAVREAVAGNFALAKEQAKAALTLVKDRDVEAMSAIALGLAGDSAQAEGLAVELGNRNPQDTIVQFNALPAIHAAVVLRSDPLKAIEALTAATPFELGQTTQDATFCLYPIYLRGEAYLAAKEGPAAAAEFQKILDHPGLAQNQPIGALAHLELGRARALAGDIAKAKDQYRQFLTLWKDADPDIPILRQAVSEYGALP